jgi:hypothetical protein
VTFASDDPGFEEWRDDNPDGYIMTEGNPLVHRGRCVNMKSFAVDPRKMTSRPKRCFDDEADLKRWSVATGASLRRNCKNCGS